MITIAIVNQKGGCGKTTTAVNLAASLVRQGQRVLLIDMDPQGHASLGLGQSSEQDAGLYEVLLLENEISEVINTTAYGVDLIPATISLAAVEQLLADFRKKDQQLLLHLQELPSHYDMVILDCPPQLGLLSFNALRAADQLIIPVEMSRYSLDGLDRLTETLQLLQEKYDLEIPYTILPTMVDYRTRFTNTIMDELKDRFAVNNIASPVHYTVRIREAAYQGKPITTYAPSSPASDDYMRLAENIIKLPQGMPDIISDKLEAEYEMITESERQEFDQTVAAVNLNDAATNHQEVRLNFRDLQCNKLQIAGEFNNWIPDQNVETQHDHGILKKILRIPPGQYQYRLIVDGKWQKDPNNPSQVLNSYGEVNSLLKVHPEPALDSV